MKRGGSAALAAMIKQKSTVLYGSQSQDANDNLEGVSGSPLRAEPEAKPVKYQPSVTTFSGASKCCICDKTVYKTEETIAVGRTWHNGCFTCGGSAGDGCGRVLRRDGYSDHNSQPYCTACSSKLFKPKGYGHGTALHLDSGVPAAPSTESPVAARVPPPPEVPKTPEPVVVKEVAAPVPPAPPAPVTPEPPKPLPTPVLKDIKAAVAAKEEVKPVKYTPKVVTMAFNSTPKCTICAKSVYKMEEMVAVGRIWHLNCFTCGGSSSEGCKRVLKRDGYVDHENNPFCIACHSKLYRPKGFGFGNTLNTDYGPAPVHTESEDSASAVTAGVAKLSTAHVSSPVASPQATSKPAPPPAPPASAPVAAPPVPTPPAHVAPAPPASAPPAPAAPATPVSSPSVERKPVAGVTGPAPAAGSIAIGASSRSAGGVFKEAAYVGDNDEVDENEWE